MSTNGIGNLNNRINFLQMTAMQKSRQLQNIEQSIMLQKQPATQSAQMSETEIIAAYGGDNKYDAVTRHQHELDALEQQRTELQSQITETQQEIQETKEQLEQAKVQEYLDQQAQEMQTKLEQSSISTETREQRVGMYEAAKQLAAAQGFTLPEGTDVVKDEDGNFVLTATVGEGDYAETITAKNATELKQAYDKANQTKVIVQDGETLESLASRYGVTPQQLIDANPDLVKSYDTKNEFGESTGKTVKGFGSGEEIIVPSKIDPKLLEGNLSSDEAKALTNARLQQETPQADEITENELYEIIEQEHKIQTENEEIKRKNEQFRKEGKEVAEIMYNDMKGLGSGDLVQNIEKVTKENAADVVLGYREISPDESLSEAILDEFGLSPQKTEKVLTHVFDNLVTKAKENGMDTSHYEEHFKLILEQSIQAKSGSNDYGLKNHDELDAVFEGLASTIKGTTISETEKAAIEDIPFEEFKNEMLNRLNTDISNYSQTLQNQIDEDGFIAKSYDGIKLLSGNSNNKVDIAESIDQYQQLVSVLSKCETEEEFKAKFKEEFGIEYNPVLIENYFNKQEQLAEANAAASREQSFNNNTELDDLLGSLGYYDNKALGRGYQKPEQKYESSLKALAHELGKIETNEGTVYDLDTAYKYIENKFKAAGYSDINSAGPQQYQLLKDIAAEYKEFLHQQTLNASDGKSIETLQAELNGAYNGAFGVTNNISRDVQEYCTSQKKATAIGKAGLKAVAALTISIASGGTALPLMTTGTALTLTAAATATSSFAIDVIDSLTSTNGLSKEEALTFGKNALIDGFSTYAGGVYGKTIETLALAKRIPAAFLTNIEIGGVAEYMKTGTVSIQGVLCNGIFGAAGTLQGIRLSNGKIVKMPKHFKNYTVISNKLTQTTVSNS